MPVAYTSRARVTRLMMILAIGLPACTATISKDQRSPIADEVLRPIAAQETQERISKARALLAQINLTKEQLAAGQVPKSPESRLLFNGVVALMELDPDNVRETGALRSFADGTVRKPREARKAEYQEILAWLDRRKGPLQDELTRRLLAKTVETDKGFLVCVDGVQRKYEKTAAGHLTRQADQPGGC